MQTAKKGDKVKIHYHGTLENGQVFDSSLERSPLEFELGSGMVIPGFDNGVMGMQLGEKKQIKIPFHEGYGPINEEMIFEYPKTNFPPEINPEIGVQLTMNSQDGQQFLVTVVEVKEAVVILDANHMLAGKNLIFDLELIHIDAKSLIIMP
ncbi:MAG: FKBP-type peptidyl-prolyl cis-trans isomerase [Sediminibacterium sp.]|nr:FKBP-type peptidyl-prolyl cis-trans isomerase [Sediminibacterium sp.]